MSDDKGKALPKFADGGVIENDPGEHGDAVPAFLTPGDQLIPAIPSSKAIPVSAPMHHEGTTCVFCGKPDSCGHSQVNGCALITAAPWVPNVWVKSCQGNLG